MIDGQDEPDVVLEHRGGQGADPVRGGAAQIRVEHHERPRLEPPADGEDRADGLGPVERAVRGVGTAPAARITRTGPRAAASAGGVSSDGAWSTCTTTAACPAKCASRPARTAPATAATVALGPAVAQAHHEVGGADPLDGGPDLGRELERFHHRVRCASSAR